MEKEKQYGGGKTQNLRVKVVRTQKSLKRHQKGERTKLGMGQTNFDGKTSPLLLGGAIDYE